MVKQYLRITLLARLLDRVESQLLEEPEVSLSASHCHEGLVVVMRESLSSPGRQAVAGNHHRKPFRHQARRWVVPQVVHQFQNLQ